MSDFHFFIAFVSFGMSLGLIFRYWADHYAPKTNISYAHITQFDHRHGFTVRKGTLAESMSRDPKRMLLMYKIRILVPGAVLAMLITGVITVIATPQNWSWILAVPVGIIGYLVGVGLGSFFNYHLFYKELLDRLNEFTLIVIAIIGIILGIQAGMYSTPLYSWEWLSWFGFVILSLLLIPLDIFLKRQITQKGQDIEAEIGYYMLEIQNGLAIYGVGFSDIDNQLRQSKPILLDHFLQENPDFVAKTKELLLRVSQGKILVEDPEQTKKDLKIIQSIYQRAVQLGLIDPL